MLYCVVPSDILCLVLYCCLVCSERVGGAGDRGPQVGSGERGGGAHVERPELRDPLQQGGAGRHVLKETSCVQEECTVTASLWRECQLSVLFIVFLPH